MSSGASLLRLFRKGNHQVTAALDAYDRVSDMGELVDALTHAVSAT